MPRSLTLLVLPCLAGLLGACGSEQPATHAPVAIKAAPPVTDGSLMEPGRPQLERLPARVVAGAVQPVSWNMWWGENGQHWAMYVNGVEVGSGELSLATPKAQQAGISVPMNTPGRYEIKVTLCNDHGCSESEPALMDVSAS